MAMPCLTTRSPQIRGWTQVRMRRPGYEPGLPSTSVRYGSSPPFRSSVHRLSSWPAHPPRGCRMGGRRSPNCASWLRAAPKSSAGQVFGIVYRCIDTHLIARAGFCRTTMQTGAVTLIQRFCSALNLDINFAVHGGTNAAGAAQLKTPDRDGMTHVIFEPLDFIAWLVVLVPKPRVDLPRFRRVRTQQRVPLWRHSPRFCTSASK